MRSTGTGGASCCIKFSHASIHALQPPGLAEWREVDRKAAAQVLAAPAQQQGTAAAKLRSSTSPITHRPSETSPRRGPRQQPFRCPGHPQLPPSLPPAAAAAWRGNGVPGRATAAAEGASTRDPLRSRDRSGASAQAASIMSARAPSSTGVASQRRSASARRAASWCLHCGPSPPPPLMWRPLLPSMPGGRMGL